MSKQSVMKITRVRTIGVPVSDQDRALDFYLATLGFAKRIDVTLGADCAGSRLRRMDQTVRASPCFAPPRRRRPVWRLAYDS